MHKCNQFRLLFVVKYESFQQFKQNQCKGDNATCHTYTHLNARAGFVLGILMSSLRLASWNVCLQTYHEWLLVDYYPY